MHRRVLRDDLGRRVDAREARLQISVLARELVLLPRAAHEHVDLGHAIRLGHVVVRAELHRGDRRFDGAVAGDDDDLRRIGLGAQLAQRLEPVHLRHHDVDERDVERFVAQRLERRLAVARRTRPGGRGRAGTRRGSARDSPRPPRRARECGSAACRRGPLDRPVGSRGAAHHLPPAGRRMRNTLPSPTTLSTSMRPPCSVTIA